jgi:hypothetical protein
MRKLARALVCGAVGLALICGLGSAKSDASRDPAEGVPRIANDTLSAEQLATFLGIDAWVFTYEGNLLRCWIEVHEDGQKTVDREVLAKVETQQGHKPATDGRILLFIRRGEMKLHLQSGGGSSTAALGMGQDDLWWGWKTFTGSTTRLHKTETPKAGEDVVLVIQDHQEAPSSDAKAPPPKKVRLQLKARFGE